jgi:excisionase family DNA binding protein
MMQTMTVEEVAAYLKLAPVTVYRELVKRRLPGFKVGSQWRVRRDLLDDWIEDKSGWRKRFDRLWSAAQRAGSRKRITESVVAKEVTAVRRAKR